MGIYSTTTTLNTRMIGVNFDSETTALVSTLITDAENEVNKYLSRRYDLSSAAFQTSTSIPPLVKTLTTQLAEAYSWESLSRGGKESLARSKSLETRALDNLKLIADYKLNLLNSLGATVTDMSDSSYQIRCNTTDYTPTFDEGDELDWAIDPDKVSDIADAKD